MRKREFQRLAKKYLLPALPDFRLHEDLLVLQPLRSILRAITFETSAWESTRSYFWVFVQPLYVPNKTLHLTFGRRLGGPSHFWEIEKENEASVMASLLDEIKALALPFLDRIKSPQDVASRLEDMTPDNLHAKEAASYSYVLIGDRESAMSELAALRSFVERRRQGTQIPGRGWVDEILDRADLLRRKLETDPSGAKALLITWEKENIDSLGLRSLAAEG
jgi:hypothetical protein